MPTLIERINTAVVTLESQAARVTQLTQTMDDFINAGETTDVPTTRGRVPTLAKIAKALIDLAQNAVSLSGATLTGFLTLHADPAQPQHAATKNYVDTKISNHTHSYVPLQGGTLSGHISYAFAPTANAHLSNKKYVDDKASGLTGGYSGNIRVNTSVGWRTLVYENGLLKRVTT